MTRRETGQTNYIREPSRQRGNRGTMALVLTLILPPIGLLYIWGNSVFRSRGRIFLSLFALVEMTVIISLLLPAESLDSVQPVASIPVAVTAAPKQEVANALSYLEVLLIDNYTTPAPESELTEEELAAQKAQQEAELEALLNTEVYCVYGGNVKYYHATQECEGQKNSRVLTVRTALSEKLGACPNCNPPAPS